MMVPKLVCFLFCSEVGISYSVQLSADMPALQWNISRSESRTRDRASSRVCLRKRFPRSRYTFACDFCLMNSSFTTKLVFAHVCFGRAGGEKRKMLLEGFPKVMNFVSKCKGGRRYAFCTRQTWWLLWRAVAMTVGRV